MQMVARLKETKQVLGRKHRQVQDKVLKVGGG
jgi:hypothetical protein